MTIYMFGTELDVISNSGGISSSMDANYSRTAQLQSMVFDFSETPWDESNGVWVHFYRHESGDGVNGNVVFYVFDASGNEVVSVKADKGNKIEYIRIYNAEGVYADFTGPFSLTSWMGYHHYDVHIYASAGSVIVDFYQDYILVGSAQISGAPRVPAIFSMINVSRGSCATSEIIIADEDTRGMRVKTLVPAGDGVMKDWQGNFSMINEITDDANSIFATAIGQTSTFTHAETVPHRPVRAVSLGARVGAGEQAMARGVLRMGGVNHAKDFAKPQIKGALPNHVVWETNPATGLPFTPQEIETLQFGVINASRT